MLSAVVLTKNEENNIIDCLESLSFCDEIVIIDDDSKDRTVAFAKKLGARVFNHSLESDFSVQRNFGLEKAKGDLILFIDADERVSGKLKEEITHLTTSGDRRKQLNGYLITRRDFMWGGTLEHGETENMKLLRLGRKSVGKWKGKVHERWVMDGKVGILKGELLHYPHPTISEFLQEINFYSDLRANELFAMGKRASFASIILYPKAKFFLNYFWRRGFLDGTAGFVHAILMSFHSFLVRGKLWFLSKQTVIKRSSVPTN